MTRKHILAGGAVTAVLLILVSDSAISQQKDAASSTGFRVRRLAAPRTVNVADKSVADWDSSFLVLDIPPTLATERQ